MLPLPPGPNGKFTELGQSIRLLRNPGKVLYRYYQEYGPIFRLSVGGKPCAFLIGPEGNKFVLTQGFKHFHWRPGTGMIAKYFGEALFVLDGDEHKRQRRLMQPAFHPSRIEGYLQSMRQMFADRIDRWGELGRINLFDETRRMTMEAAARILLGIEVGDRYEEYKGLLGALLAPTQSVFGALPVPVISPHARAIRAKAKVWPMMRQVVHEKRAALGAAPGASPGSDVLSVLAAAQDEDGTMLSDDQVIAQALGLLFAGHDTTSGMVGFAVHLLHEHPEALQRVRDEIEGVVGRGPVGMEHLPQLRYLFLVLKETERLYPAAPMGIRGVIEEFEFGGYRVPKGWLSAYSAHASHRLPEVFADPDRFDPERFAPPREEHKRTPFGLVGFGGGPRICIGINFAQVEAAVLIVTMLQRWGLQMAPGPIRSIEYLPTIHPKKPIWAKVNPPANIRVTP